MTSLLIALLLNAGTVLPPPQMPDGVKEDLVAQRMQSYKGCLYFATEAWYKSHPKDDPRKVARITQYKCDASLQKLAAAKALGSRNMRGATIYYINELRNTDSTALDAAIDYLGRKVGDH